MYTCTHVPKKKKNHITQYVPTETHCVAEWSVIEALCCASSKMHHQMYISSGGFPSAGSKQTI